MNEGGLICLYYMCDEEKKKKMMISIKHSISLGADMQL